MNNNRQRVSIPVLGIDTSTTDTQIKDGAMQELHNLRYSGGAWRDIKPFLEKNRAQLLKTPNLITVSPDGTVTAQYPVNQNVQVAATWSDIDGEHQSQTFTEILAGEARSEIDVRYDMLVSVIVSSDSEDNRYAYYSQFEDVPEVPLTAISPEKIIDVYQHPADEKDVYLIASQIDKNTTLNRVKIINGKAWLMQTFDFVGEDFSISHFGNILIIQNKVQQTIKYYYLKSGIYTEFSLAKSPVIHQSTEFATSSAQQGNQTEILKFEQDNSTEVLTFLNATNGTFAFPTFTGKYFWGEICYFAIFQMDDGELMAPSALTISASEPFYHGKDALRYYGMTKIDGSNDYYFRQGRFALVDDSTSDTELWNFKLLGGSGEVVSPTVFGFSICPYVTIQIPNRINTDLIKNVQIYCTRVHPIWNIDKFLDLYEVTKGTGTSVTYINNGFEEYFAKNDLPNQPFYLLKTIPIEEFENNLYSMFITSDLLDNIEQSPSVYQSVDPHTYSYERSKEYNARLHIYNLEQTLFSGYGNDYFADEVPTDEGVLYSQLLSANVTYFAKTTISSNIATNKIFNKIISYPDYRCKATIYQSDSGDNSYRIPMTQAIANNLSYAVNSTDVGMLGDFGTLNPEDGNYDTTPIVYVKYPASFESMSSIGEAIDKPADTIKRANIMRVSAANNPFVFPLDNAYSFGTEDNKIITVNSAAIEMADAKTGELHLHIFTDEGIFIMQLGSKDVLYSNSFARFYDRIINPDTLAVNANLLYITSRGLHALHSSGTSLISEALNDQFNVPELDFWKTAHLTHQPKYEEVIVYNLDKDESGNAKWPNAYVFSLGNQTWSTRSWVSGSEKLFQTPSRDIVLIDDLFRVFDCNEEHRNEGDTSTIRLVSRPIKLGSMEFKRMETLIPRIEVDAAQPLRITIEASSDLVSWVTLREISTLTSNHTLTIRRTSCSARYFRISLEVDVTHNFALSGFDMEYYLRFLHRLR